MTLETVLTSLGLNFFTCKMKTVLISISETAMKKSWVAQSGIEMVCWGLHRLDSISMGIHWIRHLGFGNFAHDFLRLIPRLSFLGDFFFTIYAFWFLSFVTQLYIHFFHLIIISGDKREWWGSWGYEMRAMRSHLVTEQESLHYQVLKCDLHITGQNRGLFRIQESEAWNQNFQDSYCTVADTAHR